MSLLSTLLLITAEEVGHDTGHASTGLLEDTTFWVSLGFVAVVIVFWRMGVHKTVAGMLDKRKDAITSELEEARRLREEAQELLAQYQRRQREAEDEAKGIIEQAKRDAERMGREAREKINDQLQRRAKSAEDKIARAEAQAISEVRNQTTDVAIAAAHAIINERMDSGAQNALIDKSISDLRSKIN